MKKNKDIKNSFIVIKNFNNMKLLNYIKTIASQEHSLKFLLSKILIRTKLSPFFIIKYNGCRLRFYPSSGSRSLWIDNTKYDPIFNFICNYLHKNDTFIDVGSNIGTITLGASPIIGSNGKIYSIEPHPRAFNFLKGNIELNHFNNIEMFNVALGNSSGNILFSDKKSDDQNNVIMTGTGINVPIIRLDELIKSTNIALLKIDVEGYEKFVLTGTANLFKFIECIIFELWANTKYDHSIESVYDLLLDNNFQLFRISGIEEITRITKEYKPSSNTEDLIAIKNVDHFLLRTNYNIV